MSTLLDPVRLEQSQVAAQDETMQAGQFIGLAPQVQPAWPQIAVHTTLYAELAYAIESGMTRRPCWVPGFKDSPANMPAADIVLDGFSRKGDTTLHELMELWSASINSTDPKVAGMGRKLLHKVCRAHANFHEGDAA